MIQVGVGVVFGCRNPNDPSIVGVRCWPRMSGNNTKAGDLLDNFLLALLDLPGGTWAVSPRRSTTSSTTVGWKAASVHEVTRGL